MASIASSSQETFHKFFECWINEQDSYLHELISVSKATQSREKSSSPSSTTKEEKGDDDDDDDDDDDEQRVFNPLIDRVIQHYETYYQIKSGWVKQDVLSMLTPSWRSSFEDAFLWIGGWRPSMAFHLLYSKSGLQLEARLNEIIGGLNTGDLADLSASQVVQVDELQMKTIREEKELTEKLAEHQETVADSSMVELSEVVTELMMSPVGGGGGGSGGELSQNGGGSEVERVGERIKSTLKMKEDGLEKILDRADDLRLRTLKGVIEILSPIQTVHFLIAAAELHIRLHDWGKKKDANQRHPSGGGSHHHQPQQVQHGRESTTTAAVVSEGTSSMSSR